MKRKVSTAEFFARNPVFSLDLATRELAPPGGRAGVVERLRHHLRSGRLRLLARGLYAVLPPGATTGTFQPDPFLAAAAARPDAVFAFHSALELLGAAHSVWHQCTVYSARARRPLDLGSTRVRFLEPPRAMREADGAAFAVRRVERQGILLTTTGPERTLVEGLRRPRLAGGMEELLLSVGGFPVLDLQLLEAVLERYAIAGLWAAAGWFLERTRPTFHVPEDLLVRWEGRVPRSPQYLERSKRGGTLARRWKLIVPDGLHGFGGPDES